MFLFDIKYFCISLSLNPVIATLFSFLSLNYSDFFIYICWLRPGDFYCESLRDTSVGLPERTNELPDSLLIISNYSGSLFLFEANPNRIS